MQTPYYSDGDVTIYHAESQQIMPHLPQVDMVFADPPYNIGKAEWDVSEHYERWCKVWMEAAYKALSQNILTLEERDVTGTEI